MLIAVTILLLNVWATSAQDLIPLQINLLEEVVKMRIVETKMTSMESELQKIKNMETKMTYMETELEQLRTENKDELVKMRIVETKMTSMESELEKMKNMETKMTSMKTELEIEMKTMETKMKSMETELKQLRTENKEKVKVAFSATLSTLESGHKFIGPYDNAKTLVYENALTNIGNAYNTKTGIFTAPVKGVYYFNVVVFNVHGRSVGLAMVKNTQYVVAVTENPSGDDTEDTTSNAVCLLLEQGDQISLQLWANNRVYTDGNKRNTFSGHLLFTM